MQEAMVVVQQQEEEMQRPVGVVEGLAPEFELA